MVGPLEVSGEKLRLAGLILAVGIAVFVVTAYCMLFPRVPDGSVNLWLSNGVPLAVLLRTPSRQWPGLVVAALVGHAAAAMYALDSGWPEGVARSLVATAQFLICAAMLRHRLGDYFDLTDLHHLRWLGIASAASTLFRIAVTILIIPLFRSRYGLDWPAIMSLSITVYLGMFVLALPFLAITSRSAPDAGRFDAMGIGLLGAHAVILLLVLGPIQTPGIYLIMPSLMLLAWRYGLPGAGLGALMTVFAAVVLIPLGSDFDHRLVTAGYSDRQRGIYFELFFSVAILVSLPIAVARARQRAMAAALTDALAASEQRALQLAESEAAARLAESKALEAEAIALGAKERLRRIIETSADIICTVDAKGRFIEVSENCRDIWGWPREALLGRECIAFMRQEDRETSLRAYGDRQSGVPIRIGQNVYLRPDGTEVPMSWSATWIDAEQVSHCIGRDMTEYNALLAQAQLSQRMEAIGQLTGGIAHDFNNLLTIVIGSSETIVEESTQPSMRRTAALILKAAEQGRELTKQLLAFSRRQPLEPRALDINELIDGTVPLIRRALGADLQFSIETMPNLRAVFADPTQTEAAILNLCINARDAMPDGGQLRIRTENRSITGAYAYLHPEVAVGDYAAIHVSDTGTGIAPELIDRIFEPFFTTKETGKGSGLGLSMVYGFVQQSGGHVSVVSEPGRGTTFTLYLPLAPGEAAPIAVRRPIVKTVVGGSETILVVEDNDLVRDHVSGQFASLGYRVVQASTGREAIDILEQREDIDLLFTDIVMPGGMNGRELGERAAARWPTLRILYTSGYSRDALTQDGRLVDGVTLLSKPYSNAELAEKARAVLGTVDDRKQATG